MQRKLMRSWFLGLALVAGAGAIGFSLVDGNLLMVVLVLMFMVLGIALEVCIP